MRKQKPDEDELTDAMSVVLKERRMLLGLSPTDVAERSGLDRSYLYTLEKTPRNMSLRKLVKLAQALEIPFSKLLARAERLVKENRRRGLSDR